jgi:CheY-like chemotaxis protein
MKNRIMLVEDELITAVDIQRMLERKGFRVMATISSGKEAVEKAKEILPDLIIMDIFLSNEMDGIEATDQIVSQTNIPVIYLTANADPTTLRRAYQTKHYGYLLKPIKPGDLNSIVVSAIRRHEIESKKNKHAPEGE